MTKKAKMEWKKKKNSKGLFQSLFYPAGDLGICDLFRQN